jgi:DUF971 family protein
MPNGSSIQRGLPHEDDGFRRHAEAGIDLPPAAAFAQFGPAAWALVEAWEMAAPTEMRVSKDRRLLTLSYGGQPAIGLPAELLRVLSPSAEVQGHSPQQRVTVPGKRDVAILRIEPVGNYAVRIVFDDMHDTGIYSWDYLHTLGLEKEARWQSYLDELAGKNLSRDPVR